jgi:hypothetical protein
VPFIRRQDYFPEAVLVASLGGGSEGFPKIIRILKRTMKKINRPSRKYPKYFAAVPMTPKTSESGF